MPYKDPVVRKQKSKERWAKFEEKNKFYSTAEYFREYYKDNNEVRRAYANTWRNNNLEASRASYRKSYKKAVAALKVQCFEAYGGRCECCGETNFAFLTLDHIFNDGYKDKGKGSRGGSKLYRQLRREGFPKERIRLLCWNCNCGRAQTPDKQCPHLKQGSLIMGLSAGLLI